MEQDRQVLLIKAGVPETLFNSLEPRMGALRYGQSIWQLDRFSKEEVAQEWAAKSPLADELRSELEHTFRYAFRARPDLMTKVQQIKEGTGNQDLVQDLSDLAVLGEANLALLQKVSFDETKLAAAAASSVELSSLLAIMNGERSDSNSSKRTGDKAYTLLKTTVDEIRGPGKFVFWKDAKRLKGYKSIYNSK